jgi:transcriptional regulator with XRE-family HTH domain
MNHIVELGEFLRSCRGRLTPAEAGMPRTSRRRVPGLRREELAQLAGLSVDYYTRLEQGRSRSASPEILESLATALRLDDTEHAHLFDLANRRPTQHRETRPAPPASGSARRPINCWPRWMRPIAPPSCWGAGPMWLPPTRSRVH